MLVFRVFLLSCNRKCCDADFQIVDAGKDFAAADEGGTGGEDVVDQQDVFPGELVGMMEAESILDVFLAIGGGLEALFVGVAVAHQGACVNGAVHYLRDTATEEFALVVATLQAAAPVQGDWYQEVDVVETA